MDKKEKKDLILKIEENLKNEFKSCASLEGKSMNSVMVTLIEEYVKESRKESEAAETRRRNIAMYPSGVYVDNNGTPLDSNKLPTGFFGNVPKELEDKLPKSYKPEDF